MLLHVIWLVSMHDAEDSMQGLSEEEAAKRLQQDGPNALSPPKQTPEIVKFLKQLFGGFAMLLWIGSILCFFAYTLEEVTSTAPKDYVSFLLVEHVIFIQSSGNVVMFMSKPSILGRHKFSDAAVYKNEARNPITSVQPEVMTGVYKGE